jgi:hypothetical protein
MRCLSQERGRLHDLTALAISTLRHAQCPPSFLDRVIAPRIQSLDCGHRPALNIAHGCLAGTHRVTVKMYGARAALGDATAEFSPGQTKLVAEIPEQWHRRIAVECALLTVYMQLQDTSSF